MTIKADVNAEEWSTLEEAPVLCAMRVITASRGGMLRESLALAKAYVEARRQGGDSELLDELVAKPPAIDRNKSRGAADLDAAARTRLDEAVAILQARGVDGELDAYKRFVYGLAETVAKAHKEGGVLGIGGKQVSEGEQAVLDDLRATLGL